MRVVREFTVARPPKEVFEYIAVNYFDNHEKFDPEIFGMIKHTEGPVRKGTKGSEIRKFAGKRITLDFEVTVFEAAANFSFKNTSGPFLLERSYSLEALSKGTKVIFVFDIDPKNLPVKLLFPILSKTFRKNVHNNIQLLNKLLK